MGDESRPNVCFLYGHANSKGLIDVFNYPNFFYVWLLYCIQFSKKRLPGMVNPFVGFNYFISIGFIKNVIKSEHISYLAAPKLHIQVHLKFFGLCLINGFKHSTT